jgi:hypothetical protein
MLNRENMPLWTVKVHVCHHRSYPWGPILKHLKSRYAAELPFEKCFDGVWKPVDNCTKYFKDWVTI